MAIPEAQLERWSHQGAVTTAKQTHESIRHAHKVSSILSGVRYEVYLQGSYKNDTNIRGDSDVDVIVQLDGFDDDISLYHNLSPNDRRRLLFQKSEHSWSEFYVKVAESLRQYYGDEMVKVGNKAIKVRTPYLSADVVVCARYRLYDLQSSDPNCYVEGIIFWTLLEGRPIVNFPNQHYQNGVSKNKLTKGNYKPTVRTFKNARSCLVEKGFLLQTDAPSYFIECLLYNVPDNLYLDPLRERFANIIRNLYGILSNTSKHTNFLCQNRIVHLFGNTPEQWSVVDAIKFLETLWYLWENWERI